MVSASTFGTVSSESQSADRGNSQRACAVTSTAVPDSKSKSAHRENPRAKGHEAAETLGQPDTALKFSLSRQFLVLCIFYSVIMCYLSVFSETGSKEASKPEGILLLYQNQLNGTIPALSELTDLEVVALFHNRLSGEIPEVRGLKVTWRSPQILLFIRLLHIEFYCREFLWILQGLPIT